MLPDLLLYNFYLKLLLYMKNILYLLYSTENWLCLIVLLFINNLIWYILRFQNFQEVLLKIYI